MANEENKVEKTEAEQAADINSLKAELDRMKAENERKDSVIEKLQKAQSNASSEVSNYKKQLQERMSEKERADAETKELIETLRAENEKMKREQDVAVRTAAYIGIGFDEATAKQAAEAFGGNFEDSIIALKNFITAHDKALNADALRSTPRPDAGATDPTITKEQFEHMTYRERAKLYEEQPELYNKLKE